MYFPFTVIYPCQLYYTIEGAANQSVSLSQLFTHWLTVNHTCIRQNCGKHLFSWQEFHAKKWMPVVTVNVTLQLEAG